MSRRVTISQNIIDALTQAVSKGLYLDSACALVGIGVSTYYQWAKRGESEPDSLYSQLTDAVKKAESVDQETRLARIAAAAKGGAVLSRETVTDSQGRTVVKEKLAAPAWQADGWGLERRYNDRYGQRSRQEVTGAGGARLLFSGVEFRQVGEDEVLETVEVVDSGSPWVN